MKPGTIQEFNEEINRLRSQVQRLGVDLARTEGERRELLVALLQVCRHLPENR